MVTKSIDIETRRGPRESREESSDEDDEASSRIRIPSRRNLNGRQFATICHGHGAITTTATDDGMPDDSDDVSTTKFMDTAAFF